jgi:hypothetical protein
MSRGDVEKVMREGGDSTVVLVEADLGYASL